MEEESSVSPEIYGKLAIADWETLGKNMLARAVWRGSTRYRITDTTIFARGHSIEDVVSHIIQSVFEGKRIWDPDATSLEDWLLSQVDSVMDWWLKLRENKNMAYQEFENVEQKEDRESSNVQLKELEVVLKYGPPDPEALLIRSVDEEEAKDLYNSLFDEISDEPELQEVILAMMDEDNVMPNNIAAKIGVPVEEIYNRKKRLKRRLDKLMATPRKSLL